MKRREPGLNPKISKIIYSPYYSRSFLITSTYKSVYPQICWLYYFAKPYKKDNLSSIVSNGQEQTPEPVARIQGGQNCQDDQENQAQVGRRGLGFETTPQVDQPFPEVGWGDRWLREWQISVLIVCHRVTIKELKQIHSVHSPRPIRNIPKPAKQPGRPILIHLDKKAHIIKIIQIDPGQEVVIITTWDQKRAFH